MFMERSQDLRPFYSLKKKLACSESEFATTARADVAESLSYACMYIFIR